MHDPRLIILLLVATASIAAPIVIIGSRRRVYEVWAKVASILLCAIGLGWTGLAFTLIRMGDAEYGPIGVLLTHARILLAGVALGLIIAVLIARPYKLATNEKTQTTV